MRMYGFILVFVLLLAGAAQAVNTVVPLNGQSQQGLIGHVEPAGSPGQGIEASGPPGGALQPVLEVYPDLSSAHFGDPAASLAQGGESMIGQPGGSLIEGLDNTADWATGHHWSTDPERYTDAGFVDASSRINLPAFAEIDWVATPLPTASRTSVMEILILPALAAVVVIFILAMLIVRLRRRRSLSRAEQLLHV